MNDIDVVGEITVDLIGHNIAIQQATDRLEQPPAVLTGVSAQIKQTSHSQPNWLQTLCDNFIDLIIGGCSSKTKIAVQNNSSLEV